MSVLKCDRGDCTNILCDRLSDRWGYICDECFDELTATGVDTKVGEFMDSRVDRDRPTPEEAYQYFNRMFRSH